MMGRVGKRVLIGDLSSLAQFNTYRAGKSCLCEIRRGPWPGPSLEFNHDFELAFSSAVSNPSRRRDSWQPSRNQELEVLLLRDRYICFLQP